MTTTSWWLSVIISYVPNSVTIISTVSVIMRWIYWQIYIVSMWLASFKNLLAEIIPKLGCLEIVKCNKCGNRSPVWLSGTVDTVMDLRKTERGFKKSHPRHIRLQPRKSCSYLLSILFLRQHSTYSSIRSVCIKTVSSFILRHARDGCRYMAPVTRGLSVQDRDQLQMCTLVRVLDYLFIFSHF